jgi:hypothetical protein
MCSPLLDIVTQLMLLADVLDIVPQLLLLADVQLIRAGARSGGREGRNRGRRFASVLAVLGTSQ